MMRRPVDAVAQSKAGEGLPHNVFKNLVEASAAETAGSGSVEAGDKFAPGEDAFEGGLYAQVVGGSLGRGSLGGGMVLGQVEQKFLKKMAMPGRLEGMVAMAKFDQTTADAERIGAMALGHRRTEVSRGGEHAKKIMSALRESGDVGRVDNKDDNLAGKFFDGIAVGFPHAAEPCLAGLDRDGVTGPFAPHGTAQDNTDFKREMHVVKSSVGLVAIEVAADDRLLQRKTMLHGDVVMIGWNRPFRIVQHC